MNNLKIFLIISFSMVVISCAKRDNSSEEKTWSDEQVEEIKKSEYVSIESYENIFAKRETNKESEDYTKSNPNDYFIVKYDNFGIKIWSEKLMQNDNESGISIVSDTLGNIYSASYSRVGRYIHTNSVVHDMYLTKYNRFGIKQWIKKLGQSFANYGIGLALDLSDNVYVIVFSSSLFENKVNFGDEENFLIKFNSFGKKQWTKKLGSLSSELFLDVWVDTSNHIHVTGITNSNFVEDLNDQNNEKILVSYNSDGVLQ